MSPLLLTLLATFIVSSLSLLGGFILLRKKVLSDKNMPFFVSFAVGVMLTTAFIDLLPEAVESGTGLPIFEAVLFGVVLFFFLERFVLWFHHHDNHDHNASSAVLILVGDGIHNIFDGIAIAAAFWVSPLLGVVTTIAIAAHEIPHEIADFTILIHGGMKKSKALYFNFLTALTAFIGAIGGYFFLSQLKHVLPLFLAFSAGMFIYIACCNLIPDLQAEFKQQKKWSQSLPFLFGLLIGYALITSLH